LEEVWVYRLGDKHLSEYVDRILQVSPTDLQRVAAAHIAPEDMVVVMVGDWQAIAPQLEGLDLGPVQHRRP
jgi:predicted Zn-dependent peptidase